MMPIPSRLLAPLALLLCLFVPAVCGAAANATAKPAAKANGAAPAKKAEEKKPDAKKPDAKKPDPKKTDPKKADANATPKPEPKPEPKPDKKTPPPFEMKTYMDGHKLLLQTLKNAKAFMEKEKSASQARAGMANYFLAEIDQATLLVNNGFDLVFLYFDHFLTAEQLSTVMAAYIGNRIREVGHSLEDLANEMAENLAKSPFAKEQVMVDLHGQITGYHVTLGQVSQRVIPAR